MADPRQQETQPIKEIAIDYTPEACTHCQESNTITLTYDHRGGARWRSTNRFLCGTFSSLVRCPKGNTNGLNFNLYLSSLEGHKSQDEIDFEFLGKDKTIVQTNFFTVGKGNREQIHELGLDCSYGFHEYVIKWQWNSIEWLIDGKLMRREERKDDEDFPEKPMFLYASIGMQVTLMRGGGVGHIWDVMHPMFVSTRMLMFLLQLQSSVHVILDINSSLF